MESQELRSSAVVLQVQKQRRQEGGALGKRVDLDVLVVGVRPSALYAQAVERGNPNRCREVAVTAASGRALGDARFPARGRSGAPGRRVPQWPGSAPWEGD